MTEPTYAELLEFVSRVRTCDESGVCCRSTAAALLGEPVDRCGECGRPVLAGATCPCLQYVGEPPNPAALAFHRASKGA